MKNSEIVNIITEYNKGTTMKLPAAIAWKRRLNIDKLKKANDLILEAIREAREPFMDDEHSEDMENGERKIFPQYVAEFIKATNDVLDQETDIDIKKVKIEDLGDVTISDSEMETLAFMIEE